jgi:uncharacterized protein YkwD
VKGIYNQGSEPSCVAFSTAGLASTEDFRGDQTWDTLDGHLFYRECGGNGTAGIDSRLALDKARNDGIPIQGGTGRVRVGTYVFATQQPGAFREEIAAAIMLGHFVTIALLLPSDFGWNSTGAKTSGYHQIYAVGFTGMGDSDYVICVNSWGPGSGRNGFVRVFWGYLESERLQNGYCYAFAVTPLVLPNPNPQPTPNPDIENEMIRLVNGARAQNGLPALTVNAALMKSAGDYAQEMGATGNYSHTGKDSSSPQDRMRRAGFTDNGTWGENIAAGQTDPSAPVLVSSDGSDRSVRSDGFPVPMVYTPMPGGSFTDWMNSPGHRGNILNPAFTDFGAGHANVPGSQYGHYWVQDFAVAGGGPTPDPTPTPVDLRVDGVLGTASIAAAAPGETFRVTGSGFGAGVIQPRIGGQLCEFRVQTDGLLVVTAPLLPSDLLPLTVRREGVEVLGPSVVVLPGSGPTPTPDPTPTPTPMPTPGELKFSTTPPVRLSRSRVLIQAGISFQGVGVAADVTVAAGARPLGTVRTLANGLARLIVEAVTGTQLTIGARDDAGHLGAAAVTV